MPKERIDARPGYEPDGPDGHGRSVVEVSWGRETEHVQVVSKAIDRFTGDPYTARSQRHDDLRASRYVRDEEVVEGEPAASAEDLAERIRSRLPAHTAEQALSRLVVRTRTEAEPHFTEGMYVDLDRRGINSLIAVLRRARDQAFGKDE